MRGWLTLTPTTLPDGSVDLEIKLDEEQVKAFVAGVAKQLDRPAFDGSVDWDREAAKVVVLQASERGQKADVDAGAAAVIAALSSPVQATENGDAAPSKKSCCPSRPCSRKSTRPGSTKWASSN